MGSNLWKNKHSLISADRCIFLQNDFTSPLKLKKRKKTKAGARNEKLLIKQCLCPFKSTSRLCHKHRDCNLRENQVGETDDGVFIFGAEKLL